MEEAAHFELAINLRSPMFSAHRNLNGESPGHQRRDCDPEVEQSNRCENNAEEGDPLSLA